MRKILLTVLTAFYVLMLAGCDEPSYELPDGEFCFMTDGSEEPGEPVVLSTEDKTYIISVLNAGKWTDNMSNCSPDHIFLTNSQEIRYHSECGTFTDVTGRRVMTVTGEEREAINNMLSEQN